MTSTKDIVTPSASEQLTGRVKWFNNKAGYGFITVTDGPRTCCDIFVHHSTIQVENQQYKYLVQGEYVDFGITKTSSGAHEWQAVDVHGIKGGKLMCETRHEFKIARTSYKTTNTRDSSPVIEDETPRMPKQQRVPREQSKPRARGDGLRSDEKTKDGEKKSWTMVDKNSKPNQTRSKVHSKQL
jgi:CspA family cold shock protein